MNRNEAAANEDFVARQLAHLVRSGLSARAAHERLNGELSETQRPALARLASSLGLVETAGPQMSRRPERLLLLAELYRLAGTDVASSPALFLEFQARLTAIHATLDAFWIGARSMLAYFGAVLLVAAATTAIFAIFVFPQFEAMHAGLNAQLPDLTRAAFGRGGVIATLLLLLTGGFWLTILWFAQRLVAHAEAMRPLAAGAERLPLIGDLAREYKFSLALGYARVLMAGDLPPAAAWNRAARLAGVQPTVEVDALERPDFEQLAVANPDLGRLAGAQRLGTLAGELAITTERQQLRLADALVAARGRVAFAMRAVLFFVVGSLLVAMYLPIFKLGSVL